MSGPFNDYGHSDPAIIVTQISTTGTTFALASQEAQYAILRAASANVDAITVMITGSTHGEAGWKMDAGYEMLLQLGPGANLNQYVVVAATTDDSLEAFLMR